MTTFTAEILKSIKSGRLTYYKLFQNNRCQFDEFCNDLDKNSAEGKEIKNIYTYMDFLSIENEKLPTKKFKLIKGVDRLYEFKTKKLRVYVYKQEPDVIVILGGYKTTQKEDISKIKLITKSQDFKDYIKALSTK
ncbi:MAG: hypothetical protein LBV71_20165 [Prevotella sp.]|jgi:putative component of toxin-antitoxin plasmid stabilization module|nr:hypothetical protein [Prevotella sp.]